MAAGSELRKMRAYADRPSKETRHSQLLLSGFSAADCKWDLWVTTTPSLKTHAYTDRTPASARDTLAVILYFSSQFSYSDFKLLYTPVSHTFAFPSRIEFTRPKGVRRTATYLVMWLRRLSNKHKLQLTGSLPGAQPCSGRHHLHSAHHRGELVPEFRLNSRCATGLEPLNTRLPKNKRMSLVYRLSGD